MDGKMNTRIIILTAAAALFTATASADDGSQLWLDRQRGTCTARIESTDRSAMARTAVGELGAYWNGCDVTLTRDRSLPDNDGFVIERSAKDGTLTVKARRSAGLLYGAYELLRIQRTRGINTGARTYRNTGGKARMDSAGGDAWAYVASSAPAFAYRILDITGTPCGGMEQGNDDKAAHRLDDVNGSKGTMSIDMMESLTTYCRANASIGINGSVINGGYTSPDILTTDYIDKVKTVADVMRPYGIRVYLAVTTDPPTPTGNLGMADITDKTVQEWWAKKIKEIYKKVPDFGGFFIEACPEGPSRHATDGCPDAYGVNMLAKALAQYRGIVVLRGFGHDGFAGNEPTAMTASKAGDDGGKPAGNIVILPKSKPQDIMANRPYGQAPGSTEPANTWAELPVTQYYLGQASNLTYLAPIWKEFYMPVGDRQLGGIAGTADMGDDTNWRDAPFTQANWYAFGRLAWCPELSPDSIAHEWLEQTFAHDTAFVNPMAAVMAASHEPGIDRKSRNGATPLQYLTALSCMRAGRLDYFASTWQAMRPYVDDEIYTKTAALLSAQLKDAEERRATCMKFLGYTDVRLPLYGNTGKDPE